MSRKVEVPSVLVPGSSIFIVGEAPGEEEETQLLPFVGTSGRLLGKMLHEAGTLRSACSIGNVCRRRPKQNDIGEFVGKKQWEGSVWSQRMGRYVSPDIEKDLDKLAEEIVSVNPNVVLALGNTPLLALCGVEGVTKWRGSIMETSWIERRDGSKFKVIPTYHPAAILRQWSWFNVAVEDIRRAVRESGFPDVKTPPYSFLIRPSFTAVMERLWGFISLASREEGLRLAVDIETKGRQITCLGIADSPLRAVCIPFYDSSKANRSYWSLEEELEIILVLQKLLLHPGVRVVGQGLLYDLQYIARQWGFLPEVYLDTMLAHHTNFPLLPKSLDFLSSLYCKYHRYWKDERKEWGGAKVSDEQLWVYNCKDCVATFECSQEIERVTRELGLEEQVAFEMSLVRPVLHMMLRGVKVDLSKRDEIGKALKEESMRLQKSIDFMAGRSLNTRSPKDMKEFFYGEVGVNPVLNRKTGNPTLDDEALALVAAREPIVSPIVRDIRKLRSVMVFRSTFIEAEPDRGRMHCSYNIAGTSTFRFSSSKDAFGFGMNLQNIPKGGEDLPNVRSMFIPDEGCTMLDCDLERADFYVVVWESDDEEYKQMLREGVDIHQENANLLGCPRSLAKTFIHATNYGGKPRTLASRCGVTVAKAEQFQKRYFQSHPGIKDWHRRVESQLASTRTVRNAFGFRCYFFERPESCLPEALAWIPQSTVAIAINKGLLAVHRELLWCVEPLLQVHDSVLIQTRPGVDPRLAAIEVRKRLEVVVPYPDPLVIPVGVKMSGVSWGDC